MIHTYIQPLHSRSSTHPTGSSSRKPHHGGLGLRRKQGSLHLCGGSQFLIRQNLKIKRFIAEDHEELQGSCLGMEVPSFWSFCEQDSWDFITSTPQTGSTVQGRG